MEDELIDQNLADGTRLSPEEVVAQFRELFQAELARSPGTLESTARCLGMTARNLQRILNGQQKLTASMLVDFGNVLALDKSRATMAIERFSDWRAYYDPTMIIAVDLLKPVVEKIHELTTTSMEPLHPKAVEQLSRWIAEIVIKHQLQICARREELELIRQF